MFNISSKVSVLFMVAVIDPNPRQDMIGQAAVDAKIKYRADHSNLRAYRELNGTTLRFKTPKEANAAVKDLITKYPGIALVVREVSPL